MTASCYAFFHIDFKASGNKRMPQEGASFNFKLFEELLPAVIDGEVFLSPVQMQRLEKVIRVNVFPHRGHRIREGFFVVV